MLTYEMTADEVVSMDPELAIIPVGSLEQHGPHLPIMTDWAIATAMGKLVAQRMHAFCLPALPISTNREHMGKKGSVWMEPTTFYQMLTDIILSLKTQGFKKVGIIQCHGGIFIMKPTVRDLNAKYNPELCVAVAEPYQFNHQLIEEGILKTNGIHADESETAFMLAIAEETVHMERAVDCTPDVPQSYLGYGSIFRASPSGVWGQPTKATKETG